MHHDSRVRTDRVERIAAPLLAVLVGVVAVAGPAPPAAADGRLPQAVLPRVRLVAPVDGRVLRPFDPPLSAYGAGHRGVDLAAAVGDRVRASAAGVVTFAGQVAGRPVLTIHHGDGVDTTYEPVRARMAAGDRVGAGEVVGTVSTGSHSRGLHWGLRRAGVYFDPMLHLGDPVPRAGPIRLLPLDAQPAPVAAALAAPAGGSGAGDLTVPGPVTSRFGMRLHPVLKVWRLHDGVDYAAPCGVPVRSVSAGRVVLVERHPAYGNRVIVDGGGGIRHGYAHLGAVKVRAGQQTRAGDVLGMVGSTGYSTGCHLHFMAWQDGRLINPG